MKLILIRHCETNESLQNIVHGQMDFGLSLNGKKQANNLSKNLKHEIIDLICCSDLSRAIETALIVKQRYPNVKLISSPALRERNYGIYQGKKWIDVENNISRDNIESDEKLKERVLNFIHTLWLEHNSETVVIITHSGPIKILLRANDENSNIDRNKMAHGSIHVIQYDKIMTV